MKISSFLCNPMTAAVLLAGFSMVGCGGDDGGDKPPTVSGETYNSVIDELVLPTASNDFKVFDFDDDGVNDNVLSSALSILTSSTGQPIETLALATNEAILTGSSIYLVAFQTPDFTTSSGSGFVLSAGSNPSPAPCTDPADVATCGKHLEGTGSFSSSTPSTQLAGKIVSGVYEAGASQSVTLNVIISIEAGVPVPIPLSNARVKLSGISATGITTGIIGGVLTLEDRDTKTFPGIADTLQAIITRDCAPEGGACACESGSTGASVSSLVTPNATCEIPPMFLPNGDPNPASADLKRLLGTIISDDIEGVGSSIAIGFSSVGATVN